MDTKFQTSFIPKKPIMVQEVKVRGSLSIFVLVATILFLLSITAAVGVIVWKQQLLAEQESLKINLEERQKQFDFDLVDKLKRKNTKIDIAKRLLDNHIAASDVFGIIENITVQNVRYKSFEFKTPETSADNITVKMMADAKDFPTLAYQSDVLAKYPFIKKGTISNLSLQKSGFVSFDFHGAISPTDILFKRAFQVVPSATSTSSVVPSQATSSATSTSSSVNAGASAGATTTRPAVVPRPSIIPR